MTSADLTPEVLGVRTPRQRTTSSALNEDTVPLPDTAPTPDQAKPTEYIDSYAAIQRVQAGDHTAFQLIYERYANMIFRYVIFRVGHKETAEDITQDAFLRALKRIDSFRWKGRDPGAWFITIAKNLVADYYKSARVQRESFGDDDFYAAMPDRTAEGSPDTAVIELFTNRELRAAIRRLKQGQQDVIVLRFLLEFDVRETAQALGTTEGAVKALQLRAVQNLRRLLPEGADT